MSRNTMGNQKDVDSEKMYMLLMPFFIIENLKKVKIPKYVFLSISFIFMLNMSLKIAAWENFTFKF